MTSRATLIFLLQFALAGCNGRGRDTPVTVPTADAVRVAAAPSSEEPPPIQAAPRLVVGIAADGRVLVGEAVTEVDALVTLAKGEVTKNPAVRIAVRADRAARWRHFVAVLDHFKQGGVARFDLIHEGVSHPLDLPSTQSLGDEVQMVLAVVVQDTLVIDGTERTDAELAPRVRAALDTGTPFLTVVKADGDAPTGRVLDVYAALREAGAPRIALGVGVPP